MYIKHIHILCLKLKYIYSRIKNRFINMLVNKNILTQPTISVNIKPKRDQYINILD